MTPQRKAASLSTATVAVGRQGIYREDGLAGYELLFRSNVARTARLSGGQMTAEVIFGAVTLGLDSLVGDRLLFCTADREVLTGAIPVVLPPAQTVIQVPPHVAVDDEVHEGVTKLHSAGYRLAFDGATVLDTAVPLLPIASVVRVDMRLTPPATVEQLIRDCRHHPTELLAGQVADRAAIRRLRTEGFTLFQGHDLDRPQLVSGRTLAPATLGRLQQAAVVGNEDADFDVLEDVLRRDPALAHQIMRLAAAGRLGETARRINSIRDALVFAGSVSVRRWLTLLLARSSSGAAPADEFVNVLLRARACEMLAADLPGVAAGTAFTAGMLSALDELLQMPGDEIAEQLALSPQLQEGAFGTEGVLADLVRDVADYRYRAGAAAPDTDRDAATNTGITAERFHDAFASAFNWSIDTLTAGR